MSATLEMAVELIGLGLAGVAYFWWIGKRHNKRFPPQR